MDLNVRLKKKKKDLNVRVKTIKALSWKQGEFFMTLD